MAAPDPGDQRLPFLRAQFLALHLLRPLATVPSGSHLGLQQFLPSSGTSPDSESQNPNLTAGRNLIRTSFCASSAEESTALCGHLRCRGTYRPLPRPRGQVSGDRQSRAFLNSSPDGSLPVFHRSGPTFWNNTEHITTPQTRRRVFYLEGLSAPPASCSPFSTHCRAKPPERPGVKSARAQSRGGLFPVVPVWLS